MCSVDALYEGFPLKTLSGATELTKKTAFVLVESLQCQHPKCPGAPHRSVNSQGHPWTWGRQMLQGQMKALRGRQNLFQDELNYSRKICR